MTNEHIEVVKRWLAGEVFSVEELKANAARARDVEAALWDEENLSHVAGAAYAAYWAKQYEELIDDQ
jgi:hypothetical protein